MFITTDYIGPRVIGARVGWVRCVAGCTSRGRALGVALRARSMVLIDSARRCPFEHALRAASVLRSVARAVLRESYSREWRFCRHVACVDRFLCGVARCVKADCVHA